MSDSEYRRPVFIPSIAYKDTRAALKWLERAFGFEPTEILVDDKDNIVHAEMTHDEGVIMVGYEWADWSKSPASVGGANTQRIHVRISSDIDGHCDRARAAGAVIAMEPEDQFYGARTYMAIDCDGHRWTFSQPVRDVSTADMEEASGFTFKELA